MYLTTTSSPPDGWLASGFTCPGAAMVSTDSARGRETMGNNRHQPDNPDTRTGRPTRWPDGLYISNTPENQQVSTEIYLLQQLPRHHHPLDLIRALVDLGDSGPWGSFRR